MLLFKPTSAIVSIFFLFVLGIQGWLPINRPASGTFLGKLDSHFTNQLEYVMGGIEVKINFTHSSDQERLLHSADTVGWNVPKKYLLADNFEGMPYTLLFLFKFLYLE